MNPIDLSPLLQGQPEFVQRIVIELFPFLLALILILLLRWLLTLILLRPLRAMVRRTESELDDALLEASLTPIRIAIVGFSLMLVTVVFSFDAEVMQDRASRRPLASHRLGLLRPGQIA